MGEGCLKGHPLRIATTRAIDKCALGKRAISCFLYGATKSGAYMCEKEATTTGFRASKTEKRPSA